MKKYLKLYTLFLLGTSGALSAEQIYDDSDLSAAFPRISIAGQLEQEMQREGQVWLFKAQKISGNSPVFPKESDHPASISGTFYVSDRYGKNHPARFASVLLVGPSGVAGTTQVGRNGQWSLKPESQLSGTYSIRFRLDNIFWKFRHPSGALYEWQGPAVQLPLKNPLDIGAYRLDLNAVNGQAGLIHYTYLEAINFFEKNQVRIDWWVKTVTVEWPGQADYFRPGTWTINLTNAYAWDINLHELGHSILFAATRSRHAFGKHYIDQCYSKDLAWSEGFPTFFAATVYLSLNDPDAKFEFLVPRRGPIRIENVPSNVCRGDENEWRVAAALWDLADTNPDGGDASSLSLTRLWNSILNKPIIGFQGAWQHIKANLTQEEARGAQESIKQNTIDAFSINSMPLSRSKTPDRRHTSPNWDGNQR